MKLNPNAAAVREPVSVRPEAVQAVHSLMHQRFWTWDWISYEAHDPQSDSPRQPERRLDLRKVIAGKGRMETAAARRAGSGHGQASGRVRENRSRQPARSERDRNHPPLHAHVHVELRYRSRHVSLGLLHDEVQPAGE